MTGANELSSGTMEAPSPSTRHEDEAVPPSPVPRRLLTAATLGRNAGLAAVAASSMGIGLIAFSIAAWITKQSVPNVAFHWDTTWYYRISQLGYLHRTATGATDYAGLRVAFFPGLPLLERAVHNVIGGGPTHTTVVVGTAGLVASCFVLWSLVARDWGEQAAWRSVILLAFFPGAYVFPLAYSEAVAIPFALFTLLALRRRWFLAAGLAAALAGTARLVSIVLVAVCVVAAVRQLLERDRRTVTVVRAIACPFVASLGVLGYMIYLRFTTGDFFAVGTAERLGWQNHFSLRVPFHLLRLFFHDGFRSAPWVIINSIGLVAVVAAIALVVVVSMPLEYKVFTIGILGAWLFTSNAGAWFRYIEFAFPVLIALAVKVPEKVFLPIVGVCAATLGMLMVLFASAVVAFSP